MQRSQSIFEINPKAHEIVERGFETDGSNLSGVSARCSWIEIASVCIKLHLILFLCNT